MLPRKTPHLGSGTWTAPAAGTSMVSPSAAFPAPAMAGPPRSTAPAVVVSPPRAPGSLGLTWNGLNSDAHRLSCSCRVAPT
uniref:Uncharacterized protein n=1 Tax=Setaria italica TaxID=4555 RepID=K3ZFS7_SETIT